MIVSASACSLTRRYMYAEAALREHRRDCQYSFVLATVSWGTYSVGADSLFHSNRFPCQNDLSSLDKGIDCVVNNRHVYAPVERSVVILCEAAGDFARTGRA